MRMVKLLVMGLIIAQASVSFSETTEETEKRIGPWLDLSGGGIATGPAQGKALTLPDGSVQNLIGGLQNGSLMPSRGSSYERIVGEQEGYVTGMMLSLLENAAAEYGKTIWPGWITAYGEIAQKEGGIFPPHKSHQNGLDADIPFLGHHDYDSVLDRNRQVTAQFLPEKNWEFWRLLYRQQILDKGQAVSVVSMILVSPEIKNFLCDWTQKNQMLLDPENVEILRKIRPTEGHDDHFHLRLRCSPHHPLCLKENIGSSPCPVVNPVPTPNSAPSSDTEEAVAN